MAIRFYEALFLFDSAEASKDMAATLAQVSNVLTKHGATILKNEKWDDRKLAYDIGTVKRGTYIATHFQAEPKSVAIMRRDFELNEQLLRYLILEDAELIEHLAERERVKKKREQEAAQAAAEGFPLENERGRYGDRPRFSRDRDRGDREERFPRRERAPVAAVEDAGDE